MEKSMKKLIRKVWIPVVLLLMCLCLSKTTMAAGTYQVRYHETSKAYFVYQGGKVVKSNRGIVANINTATVHGKTFQKGVYGVSPSGRLQTTHGLLYLAANCNVDGVSYPTGIYKAETNGRLASRCGIVEIRKTTFHGKTFDGIYYFEQNGRFLTSPAVRKLNLTYHSSSYNGYYYFAGNNCKLRGKTGLVCWNGAYYYVLSSGRCITNENRNVQGVIYHFGANGAGRKVSMNLTPLKNQVNGITSRYSGNWSVYVKKLDSNQSFTINEMPHYGASLMKVYIMATVYDQIRQNKLTESSTVSNNLWYMITESDNTCSNTCVEILGNGNFLKGASLVNSYNKVQGYKSTELHHMFRPSSQAFVSDGKSNQTSVVNCGKILEKIYRGTCVNGQSSQKMLNKLLNQQRRWKIPAGLPAGTKVANKTGETSDHQHDIAIVYGPKCDYILCVMGSGVSESGGIQCIREISSAVYNYLEK